MNYMQAYELWKKDTFFDEDTRAQLDKLTDEKEIEDRFYRDLEFGTGGLRGIMGAGTNRMNKYTVGKASMGLGKYLLQTYGEQTCSTRGIVIAYDTRNNSKYFSEVAAAVLSGMGIKVYVHDAARPTPQLSFSVKLLKCIAGIVITASHNPKEYNGYKVYDEHGCQIVPWQAKQVIAYVDAIKDYHAISFDGNHDLIEMIDVTEEFVTAVMKQSRLADSSAKDGLCIVYTPLHGSGQIPVARTLAQAGFTKVTLLEEQADGDGDFKTVVSPNPEDRKALELGIKRAQETGADIVLGTDPDCDRVGVAVKTKEGYSLLTGNQIGAILMDYVLTTTDLSAFKHPAVVKTVVTSELGAEIAKRHGLTVFSTLTGFKFIGEKITQFEQAKATNDATRDYDFIFGYEESYGYLAGTHARDKDATVSSLLICEAAAFYKAKGITLLDKLNEIYAEYGYYRDVLDSYTLKGKDGLEQIDNMMTLLRTEGSPFADTVKVFDYSMAIDAEEGFGKLPTSNVLKYILADGSWITVRPSGTEPKIKIYYSVVGEDKEKANERFLAIQTTIQTRLGL